LKLIGISKNKINKKNMRNGFTLIETLIGIAILAIVMLGIYGIFQGSLKMVNSSRARLTAQVLINQKLEETRNLSYNKVGTVSGIPSGVIIEEVEITRNGINFTVKTTVVYIDDPFDGINPGDTLPNDYKRVKVKADWSGAFEGSLSGFTDISPKGAEQAAGSGTLSIVCFDADGAGVAQANVYLKNNDVVPAIEANYLTDDNGLLTLAGAPESVEAYQITLSKSGYSADRTYGEGEVEDPVKLHSSVAEGKLTEISFAIDKLSIFNVSVVSEETGLPIGNISFHLQGLKKIGKEIPTYKYSEDHSVDAAGQLTILNLEWDSYEFSVDKGATGFDLISPDSDEQPIDLLPDTITPVTLILGAENTLLITVKDSGDSEPIFGAGVRIFNLGLGYDEIVPTNEQGQVFFTPLEEDDYSLEIQADAYQNYSSTVTILGDTTDEALMQKLP
jgi:prepilin-type N-terminal cleavage/methylation domain-containing protein